MLTKEQVSNWKDFAIRMANTCYADSDRPPSDWIVGEVEEVFTELGDDAALYTSWDDRESYPIGHKWHGTDRQGIRNGPPYLSDLLSEMVEDPIYACYQDYGTKEQIERAEELRDKNLMDEYDNLLSEIIDDWAGQVHCCIRTGIDVVGEPIMGVLGFTAGDLQQMYPEGFPQWLKDAFTVDVEKLPADELIVL